MCASLEETDRGVEDKELKELAVKPVIKRKEAFNAHAKRTYHQYRNCEYNLLDVSCLNLERGIKSYYREMQERADAHTHVTGDLRSPF